MLHRANSTYGRLIQRPIRAAAVDEEGEEEKDLPIQDQIENLKTKISLKERYNRVLHEELQASFKGKGKHNVLQDIYYETRDLRQRLMDALAAEQSAVQNAFRSYREFQLAMREHDAGRALPWLDDKLFDARKKLNSLLDRLRLKRRKLEDAEQMVMMIEKWPRPGTLQWEIDAAVGFQDLETAMEEFRLKKETAEILSTKYEAIRELLEVEASKYRPMIRDLTAQLKVLKSESDSLKLMQTEADLFHESASKDLTLTEQEASENRKIRRQQMAKIRHSVERMLEENDNAFIRRKSRGKGRKSEGERPEGGNRRSTLSNSTMTSVEEAMRMQTRLNAKYFRSDASRPEPETILDLIRARKEDVAFFQYQARRLVDTMKVPDLTHIPGRLTAVNVLGEKIRAEIVSKSHLKSLLLNHRNHLQLIQAHFKWTGHTREKEYAVRRGEYLTAMKALDEDVKEATKKLQYVGDISVNLRMSMLSVLEMLEPERETKKRRKGFREPQLKSQMKLLAEKVKRLVRIVDGLENQFHGLPPERSYAPYVKLPTVPERLVRVGSAEVSDESDEEEFPDSRVPTNAEIKDKSKQTVQQAILKRGLQ